GRRPAESATGKRVPRQRPPMIRTLPGGRFMWPCPGLGVTMRVVTSRHSPPFAGLHGGMASWFRRDKQEPEGPAGRRRLSIEELAAAFPESHQAAPSEAGTTEEPAAEAEAPPAQPGAEAPAPAPAPPAAAAPPEEIGRAHV